MSFDEFPPDAQPPRKENEALDASLPETSPQETSPAAPRRRRSRTTKTPDTQISENETQSVLPIPRRRRTASPKTDPAADTTAGNQAENAANGDVDSNSEASATPRRRQTRRRNVEEPASDDAATPAAPRKRGRPRKVSPDAEVKAETTPPENSETKPAEDPEIPGSTSRRRTSRSRKNAPAAKQETETNTSQQTAHSDVESQNARDASSSPILPEVPGLDTPAIPSSDDGSEQGERTGRRRRNGRGRRRGSQNSDAPETQLTPEEIAAAKDIVQKLLSEENLDLPTDEQTDLDNDPNAPTGRRRRRGGRGRREPRRGIEETISTDETSAPPVVVPEIPVKTVQQLEEEREARIDRTVGAHLVNRHGCPEIHINNVVYPPVLFFGNLSEPKSRDRVMDQVRLAARAGVHLHSTLVELPCPLTESSEALDEIDSRLRALIEADPQGYVMPRIVFVPARGWKREYPTEIASYEDGTSGDPSITSARFWQEAELSLVAMINHLHEYDWSRRIFGYHLEYGEWFQPASMGHDRSIANRDAFRDWLREKYKNNMTALRAAWYDGDVQFHTAEIPAPVTRPNLQRAFYEPRRERSHIDFNEFTSESTSRRIISLARAVKRATSYQTLVSVCYGYSFEFGHPDSGHLALGLLESAQAINLICGPPSYRDRKPGGASSLPSPVNSMPLHNKLWLSEDDTKTWLAPAQQDPEDFNPRLADRFITEQAFARALGRSLSRTVGIGFMDLWGEGWLNDEELWERIGSFVERYRSLLKSRERAETPEVVVLIDEKSLMHIQRGEAFFRKLTSGLRDVLQRAGIHYGTYLQSDVTSKEFPTDAKLYLFLNPYRLTTDQRAAIKEKLQNGGKTLAWLYAPGSCEERPSVGGIMQETSTETIGFALRQQPWNAEIGSRILDPHHVITRRLPSRELGVKERLNPSFFVDDPASITLAEYQASGLPSLAVKEYPGWRSIFLGDPGLPLELLRGICRYAGAQIWTPLGDDIVSIGNNCIVIHATRDGQRTLSLPRDTALYDLTDERYLGTSQTEHRFFLRSGMTRIFCYGTPERLSRLGLIEAEAGVVEKDKPFQPQPRPRREPEIQPTVPTVFLHPDVPEPLQKDLEILEAVLSADVSEVGEVNLEDVELEIFAESRDDLDSADLQADANSPGHPGEPIATGRRRRRGGRGRGRRRLDPYREGLGGLIPATEGSQTNSSEGVPAPEGTTATSIEPDAGPEFSSDEPDPFAE